MSDHKTKSNDVKKYVQASVQTFLVDPPDSEFQQGFLSALLVLAKEALGLRLDIPPFAKAQKLLKTEGA